MRIDKLVLDNFKSFATRTELDLGDPEPSDTRNVILVGGMNGSGKTSIIEAINACLYGADADFVFARINRRNLKQGRGDVELGLDLTLDNNAKLSIRRRWSLADPRSRDPRDLNEELRITLDGKLVIASGGESDWGELVDLIIPQGVSQFFFFDGEKIQDLAADTDPGGRLRESMESVLGIQLYRTLATDLESLVSRMRRAGARTGTSQVLEAQALVQRATEDAEGLRSAGAFNWAFLNNYREAARLFNAFDYGHAVLYETLYTRPDSAAAGRELEKQYRYLTTDLLVRPPRFAVAEEVIEPNYAKLAWRAKLMFDWAHVLHRQIYDVYADERIPDARKDVLIERLTDYYLSRPDIAFVPVPKSMALMDEQYYSQVFRRRYPTFNGLIWAYHWLQVGLYEPLIAGRTPDEKKAGVQAAVARFWDMLKNPPVSMPHVMPMTATVAPEFTRRHPRAAAIFDNLHMMHDIISDILAADTVPRARKRDVIYAVLAEFRDSTRNSMTRDEWLTMGAHMGGIWAMGGPATGILARAAEPTRPEMAMGGMERGAKPGAEPARGDSMEMPVPMASAAMEHEARGAPMVGDTLTVSATVAFVRALLTDTARVRGILADSTLHARFLALIGTIPEPDRSSLLAAVHHAGSKLPRRPPAKRPAPSDHPRHDQRP